MTRAIIHLNNLRFNLKQIRNLIPEGCFICPAVKADAYGHGAVQVSRVLKEEGVRYLAVARVLEGQELRLAGIDGPILLFGHAGEDELEALVRWDLTPFAGSMDYLKALEHTAEAAGRSLKVHLKVDTGMGRLGCSGEEGIAMAGRIQKSHFLELEGLATHFPVSDSIDKDDQAFTRRQWEELKSIGNEIERNGLKVPLLHASNSGAILSHSYSHLDMVRPGIMLYGYAPDPDLASRLDLKPVMELETSISFLKQVEAGKPLSYGLTWSPKEDSWIATLPIGYADGYFRGLSSLGEVCIRGKRYPVAGRVCMDQILVNLGKDTFINLQDKAVLFGPSPDCPGADELAALLGTIPYEITCAISRRVPRIYQD